MDPIVEAPSTFVFSAEAVGGIEVCLIVAIFALVCVASWDLLTGRPR